MMDVHRLDSIFHPERIALIGISSNPNSVSGKVLINLVGGGYRGVVYPVNPDFEAIMGIACYPDVLSLPRVPDLAIICSAAEDVPQHVKRCGEAGIHGVIIMSAGFKETGTEGSRLEEEIRKEIAKHHGMRLLGPNCLGVIVPEHRMNASFAHSLPKSGNIAFISQSGALCSSVLDWALEGRIGFSYFVSIGNALDIEFADLIDYFGEDENTHCIILYIESIVESRKFMTAARAFARTKPIIVFKAGRYPESAQVAASHTGAMASEDAVYDAAFQRAGLARVYEIGDIFNVAELLGRSKFPHGSRLGIVTNAGGPGVMATDALISLNGELAVLSAETIAKLNECLPAFWSHANPVDVLGDARSKRVSKATKCVLEDPNVDAVLVIMTPQAMTNPIAIAKEIGSLTAYSKKPILAAWIGGQIMRQGVEILTELGIPSFSTPEEAIRAFMILVAYSRNLKTLYETPRDVPVEFSINREELHSRFLETIKDQGPVLSERLSKQIIGTYGISTTEPIVALNPDEAASIARQIGFPVVLKIISEQITHKSDVGGVLLNVQNEQMVREGFLQIISSAKEKLPDAIVDGVTIQPMIDQKGAVELILGIKKDKVFGTIIMVGMGGIYAELFGDKVLGLPPLNEALTRHMLESLKIFPLLEGYRGSKPKNIDKLIDVMIRLSYFAADYPEIKELDINPLIITETSAIAVDARIVIDEPILSLSLPEYHHLALHPYPEKYVKHVKLQDGTDLLLRPIKPEDEPLWLEMLGNCSKEALYSRFRYFFHWETHDVATRYCYIDYDRELAIVAETREGEERKLVGVGRLIADPDHEAVEYAILIIDAWQNRDLGNIITDYCLDIAGKWNLTRIYAQTTADNTRMISVFRSRQFKIKKGENDDLVEVEKFLS